MPKPTRTHHTGAVRPHRTASTGAAAKVTPLEDRRSATRVSPAALPPFTARVVDGPEVEILNVSRTGALARSPARLMPGAMIGFRFLTADAAFVVFGRVVRSSLVSIAESTPLYESALAFSQDFPLMPVAAQRDSGRTTDHECAQAKPEGPYPAEIGRLQGDATVLTVTTFADDPSERLRKAFDFGNT